MNNSLSSKIFVVSILMITVAFLMQSCSHYDELTKDPEESRADSDSHNAGMNCMSCHHDSKNEASEKWWYVAGTIYEDDKVASSEGIVELWTGPNGTGERLYSLPIDQSGNIYTQRIINFKGGFYPVVVAKNGKRKEMTEKTVEGSCNSCHGVTTEKIDID